MSLVVSAFEEEQQDARKPDLTRHYNLQLDSRLTITTKRRHTSTEPTDETGLRAKHAFMTNLWLLAQMKQTGRSIYKDFDKTTFNDFLDKLMDRDNFNFYKEVEGRPLIAPKWSYCLSHELELRKESIKLCKERNVGIKEALWSVLGNVEHRMKHWLQLVAIPNAPAAASDHEISELKRRLSAVENRRGRSRSPRRQQQRALTGPEFLALPASASSSSQSRRQRQEQRWKRQRKEGLKRKKKEHQRINEVQGDLKAALRPANSSSSTFPRQRSMLGIPEEGM